MPRKPEPSFSLKQIIWDIAASIGMDNFSAIYREVDKKLRQLHKKEELYEDETPDIRTLHRIIELDINRLSQEVVVAKLPPHVWRLRNDYESLKTGDPLGSHGRKLFYFGQRLRNRLYAEIPAWFALHVVEEYDHCVLPLWNRPEKPFTHNDEEESVEEDWNVSYFDARNHPVFKSFQQHLSGHAPLDILGQIEKRYHSYRAACLDAYSDVKKELEPISKRMTDEGFQRMVRRIFLFCNANLLSLDNLEVVCEEEMEADRVVMPDGSINYPSIAKRLEDKYTIDFNASLSEVESRLINTLPNSSHFSGVLFAKHELEESLQEFRRVLSPDTRLREWVLSGHCDLCP